MQYFCSHRGVEDSATCGPNFINFVVGTQGVFVPNFKSVAEIISEIWAMKYFGDYLGIESSAT